MAADAAPAPRPPLARAALLLAALAALAWAGRPDGRLHLIFPALEGDAALIRTPDGSFVLVDGGADPAALTAALGRRMPFWQRDLAAVVLTRPDARRLPGQVAALARYRAAVALAPPAEARGAAYDQWRRLLAAEGAAVRPARPGARLDLGGARITVLAADAGGSLLRVEYGATCAVLAHAPPRRVELAPGAAGCDLLAFPWERDPRDALLGALRPRRVVLTDGERADSAPELTYRERAVGGARLYHERLDGDVEWVSDGRSAAVSTAPPGR